MALHILGVSLLRQPAAALTLSQAAYTLSHCARRYPAAFQRPFSSSKWALRPAAAASQAASAVAPAASSAPPPDLDNARRTPSAPALDFNDTSSIFSHASTGQLLRAYGVLSACTIGPLVKHADQLVKLSRRLLGDNITFSTIRHTFFAHFCAGEDEVSIRPTMDMLARSGIRPIVDFAAEDDTEQQEPAASTSSAQQVVITPRQGAVGRVYDYQDELQCDKHVQTFLSAVRTVSGLGGPGFAAIKMTALGNPLLLERMSDALLEIRALFRAADENGDGFVTFPEFERIYSQLFPKSSKAAQAFAAMDQEGLGKVDIITWSNRLQLQHLPNMVKRIQSQGSTSELAREVMQAGLNEEEVGLVGALLGRTRRLADEAASRGVRLMIDAEHSYFQPAIDHTVKALQAEYNRVRPIIFNTYQCYLRGTHDALREDLERARREGFQVGAKLVRGAYMQLERARAKERGYQSPIWDTIEQTHANYDQCVALMLAEVARHGAECMIASHNQASVEKTVQLMSELHIPPQDGGVYFGQLLGMADHLSFGLGQNGYQAYKYVPYGPVPMVMPYLIRRAQENSSVLGPGVRRQLDLLRAELARRLLPGRHGGPGSSSSAAKAAAAAN